MNTSSIKLDEIRIDGGTQTRAEINDAAVEEYAADMQDGAKFPAVILFNDGANKWLADGFHRFHASRKAGFLDILAEVRTGTKSDAVKYALGANRSNGLRRDNRDKRRCVEIALKEFPNLSNRAIEELCGVSDTLVRSCRSQVPQNGTSDQPATRTGQDGKQYPVKPAPERRSAPVDLAPGEPTIEDIEEESTPTPSPEHPIINHPSNGLQYASLAIIQLQKIQRDDTQRLAAFDKVISWINQNK